MSSRFTAWMRTEKLSSARHCVAMRCQPSSQTPPCLVGMEASNGAHCWAKLLSAFGHEVRLISPQFVTPYVKSNKNDRDLAKYVFAVHGVDAQGKMVVRKTLRRNAVSTFFANSTLPRRYGSLERRSLLGKAALCARSRGAADQPPVCYTLCEVQQKRPRPSEICLRGSRRGCAGKNGRPQDTASQCGVNLLRKLHLAS